MILVRHARSVVDATVPPADWELAPEAHAAAAELGRHLRPTPVFASTERKAIDTATALGLGPVATSDAFCEVQRPWYDDAGAMARDAARWFAGETVKGWESFGVAVERFSGAVDEDSIVVTHGTVMTAWLASIGAVTDAFAFWSDMRMPDAFVVSGGGVQRYPAA